MVEPIDGVECSPINTAPILVHSNNSGMQGNDHSSSSVVLVQGILRSFYNSASTWRADKCTRSEAKAPEIA